MKRSLIIFLLLLPMLVIGQHKKTLTILNTATASDTLIVTTGYYLSGLITPAGLGQALTVKVSDVGTTMYPLQISDADTGAYTIEMDKSAAQAMLLDKDTFYPWKYFQFTSGTAAAEDETLILILRKRD